MNSVLDIKPKVEKKKIKPKKPLVYNDSDEELKTSDESTPSVPLYSKRLNLNNFEEKRQKFDTCDQSSNVMKSEDVFLDYQSNHTDRRDINENKTKNKEIEEVMQLVNDIKENEDSKPIDCNISDSHEIEVVSEQSIGYNTRSKTGAKCGKSKKKSNKKSNKKSSGINENGNFEKLDDMDTNRDIEMIEDVYKECQKNDSLNISQDLELFLHSRDFELKVKYLSVIEKFPMKRSDQFSAVMPLIADKFDANVSEIILKLNDSIITAESTPESIDLSVSDIILCFKRSNNTKASEKDPNLLTVKLRDGSKDIETCRISKFDQILKLMKFFSEKKGLPLNKFRLEFDGERLDSQQTVVDCDIDDDSQLDVIYLQMN